MAGINMKFNKIDKILRKNGFKRVRQTGDHVIYYRGEDHISIPYVKCNGLLLQRLFKENNIEI